MAHSVDALIADLLEWIGPGRRPYREVVDAWRTSCPRLPVWEEAQERGFLEQHGVGAESTVSVSKAGVRFVAALTEAHRLPPSGRADAPAGAAVACEERSLEAAFRSAR